MKILNINKFVEKLQIDQITINELNQLNKELDEKIELGKTYKGFLIREYANNSAEEFNKYGSTTIKSALNFIKTVIDEIHDESMNFNIFALFYSNPENQGFIIYNNNIKLGYILYNKYKNTWYLEITKTSMHKYYGFDNIIEELLKIKS